MHSTSYSLEHGQERDIILLPETDTRICVYNLGLEPFIPHPAELQFYGDDYGDELAFETIGWKEGELDLIRAGIQWYAGYLDYPEMELSAERRVFTLPLRVVK